MADRGRGTPAGRCEIPLRRRDRRHRGGRRTTAAILAAAGLSVVLLEEGPLKSSSDFRMREADAYPQLYQESAGRRTKDKAITILQGRCVGGGTTVNWTSSFRTPEATLAWWATHLGIEGFSPEALAPSFAEMEARLSIGPWETPPNANNAALARGARASASRPARSGAT